MPIYLTVGDMVAFLAKGDCRVKELEGKVGIAFAECLCRNQRCDLYIGRIETL